MKKSIIVIIIAFSGLALVLNYAGVSHYIGTDKYYEITGDKYNTIIAYDKVEAYTLAEILYDLDSVKITEVSSMYNTWEKRTDLE